jgi:hypothetical protein
MLVFQLYTLINEMQVQEVKSPVKNLVRQPCAKGFNSGVKGLIEARTYRYLFSRYAVRNLVWSDIQILELPFHRAMHDIRIQNYGLSTSLPKSKRGNCKQRCTCVDSWFETFRVARSNALKGRCAIKLEQPECVAVQAVAKVYYVQRATGRGTWDVL